jgi:hypothetical protein
MRHELMGFELCTFETYAVGVGLCYSCVACAYLRDLHYYALWNCNIFILGILVKCVSA